MNAGFPRPCKCDRFVRGEPFRAGQCRLCFMFYNSPFFRKLWSPVGTEIDLQWFAAESKVLQESLLRTPTGSNSEEAKRLTIKLKINPVGATVKAECNENTNSRHLRRCVDLGERIEVRAGCASGWMCRHECRSRQRDVMEHLGEVPEAVPGDDCQDCPGFVDAGRF